MISTYLFLFTYMSLSSVCVCVGGGGGGECVRDLVCAFFAMLCMKMLIFVCFICSFVYL